MRVSIPMTSAVRISNWLRHYSYRRTFDSSFREYSPGFSLILGFIEKTPTLLTPILSTSAWVGSYENGWRALREAYM